MVKQGDIIKIDFNPQSGHEQAGYRPAVVVSNDVFNTKTNMTLVCPITNTNNQFPLDSRTQTKGVILCEHIKALDLQSRNYKPVETLPKDILETVVETVFGEIEILEDN
ncbi:MAG: type II toxin-antitoxin system PemK/MazF family toxin [Oscillospiraceae bacterium]|nr:type II toxin-antitoxin system PemK/MazF family toxin [Oscillospiraceae bacterium]